ncbi:hypothetical protein GQ53DRAFT_739030 [Thozetella sp. PMI_491]|nr:hypothetical protein GQ53DRAFT_739030 [Thozetella sp. PMI_491]
MSPSSEGQLPTESWGAGGEDAWEVGSASQDLDFQFGDNAGQIYSKDACTAALRGEQVPTTDACAMSHIAKLCVLRGIRYHHGFAAELRDAAGDKAFVRALNARAIMSNEIPAISAAEEFPYCIWYPDLASEDTYRNLAQRYPQMRYQVGRACAVAGYTGLYEELQLLPDIAIAEEARDSVMRRRHDGSDTTGSQEIFQHIVGQPVRWQVMNDYTRRVAQDKPAPARHGLNSDTAVVSTLQLRRGFLDLPQAWRINTNYSRLNPPGSGDQELAPCYFNITEDWNVDHHTSARDNTERSAGEDMLELLWNPLPADLPWGDKDLLILMAAYYGNVDWYARLRRPEHVSTAEANCVIRGIYHSTIFAKWWSLQPVDHRYISAIHARFIMNNDISRITDDVSDADLPRQIWYPLRAHAATYLELARRKPAMTAAVSRALLVADHQEAWDSVDAEPYYELMEEARASRNPHYLEVLRRRCAERNLDPDFLEGKYPEALSAPIGSLAENTAAILMASPNLGSVWSIPGDGDGPGIYDGMGVDVSKIELFMAASEELRPPKGFERTDVLQLYHEQRNPPPSSGEESDAYWRRGQLSRRGGRGGSRITWGNGRWARGSA